MPNPGEVLVADLCAEAVAGLVAGASVVNRDPVGARWPGTEHLTGLGEEVVLARVQQTDNLAFGDKKAEAAQQRHEPWHRHLPLMILSKHESVQSRAELPIDARFHHTAGRDTEWRDILRHATMTQRKSFHSAAKYLRVDRA